MTEHPTYTHTHTHTHSSGYEMVFHYDLDLYFPCQASWPFACVCVCICVRALLSHVQLFVIPLTVCSSPSSSVHGIVSARVLEWVAVSFYRGSFVYLCRIVYTDPLPTFNWFVFLLLGCKSSSYIYIYKVHYQICDLQILFPTLWVFVLFF